MLRHARVYVYVSTVFITIRINIMRGELQRELVNLARMRVMDL
jgi:hypothetical protein